MTCSGIVSAAYYHRHGTHGDHGLSQHGAAGMSHVDAEACHKAVYLLGHLQEGNGAEEPNQYISGHSLLAGRCNCSLDFTFVQREGRNAQGQEE